MNFNTAVERIGFPLAVLLYENELPENLLQTATTEQLFMLLQPSKISTENTSRVSNEVFRRLSEATFEVASKLFSLFSEVSIDTYINWAFARRRDTWVRMNQLATSFEEWLVIYRITKKEPEYRAFDSESHQAVQICRLSKEILAKLFTLASKRDHWVVLASLHPADNISWREPLSSDFTLEQWRESATKILADNPSEDEVIEMGYRFPLDSPEYNRAVDAEIAKISRGEFNPEFGRIRMYHNRTPTVGHALLRMYRELIFPCFLLGCGHVSQLYEVPQKREAVLIALWRFLSAAPLPIKEKGWQEEFELLNLAKGAYDSALAQDSEFKQKCLDLVAQSSLLHEEMEYWRITHIWVMRRTDPQSEVHQMIQSFLSKPDVELAHSDFYIEGATVPVPVFVS